MDNGANGLPPNGSNSCGAQTMTKKTKRNDPTTTSQSGAWIEAPYREHPDGAKKYRHPVAGKMHDGELLDVDVVLSVAVLDRLNRIPGIDIHNVCAGHGFGQSYGVNQVATIGFYTDRDFGLWLVRQPDMPYSKRPCLFFHGGRWSVHLECKRIRQAHQPHRVVEASGGHSGASSAALLPQRARPNRRRVHRSWRDRRRAPPFRSLG